MNFPVISTSRLHLREILDSDIQSVFRGLSDPEVTRYYGVSFSTLEGTNEQMGWFRQLIQEDSGIWWAISLGKGGAFIGACGFNNVLKDHQRGEIGFWLIPEYWGNGYMREALPEILHYARNNLLLHRIEAFVETGNNKSLKLLKDLGFEREGKLRDYEIKNGKYISLEVLSIVTRNE